MTTGTRVMILQNDATPFTVAPNGVITVDDSVNPFPKQEGTVWTITPSLARPVLVWLDDADILATFSFDEMKVLS